VNFFKTTSSITFMQCAPEATGFRGHPIPTPYLPRRFRRLDPLAYGARHSQLRRSTSAPMVPRPRVYIRLPLSTPSGSTQQTEQTDRQSDRQTDDRRTGDSIQLIHVR